MLLCPLRTADVGYRCVGIYNLKGVPLLPCVAWTGMFPFQQPEWVSQPVTGHKHLSLASAGWNCRLFFLGISGFRFNAHVLLYAIEYAGSSRELYPGK